MAVTNSNGSAVLPGGFTYVTPVLYAADGSLATPGGNLYTVNTTTAATTVVGPIGFSVTAMAFGPAGTLYGVTGFSDPPCRLLTINTTTGAGSALVTLSDIVTGIEFVGSRLIAIGSPEGSIQGQLAEIDIVTGVVTSLGSPAGLLGGGNVLLANEAGEMIAQVVQGADRDIWVANPVTGLQTRNVSITGMTNGITCGGTYLDGVMYVADNVTGGPTAARNLAILNPLNGMGTDIVPMASSIDALAGSAR